MQIWAGNVTPPLPSKQFLICFALNAWSFHYEIPHLFGIKPHCGAGFFSGREWMKLPTTSGWLRFKLQLFCRGISDKTSCLCHHSWKIYWIKAWKAQSVWKGNTTKLHPPFPWIRSCFRTHCADKSSSFLSRQDFLTWILTKTPWYVSYRTLLPFICSGNSKGISVLPLGSFPGFTISMVLLIIWIGCKDKYWRGLGWDREPTTSKL